MSNTKNRPENNLHLHCCEGAWVDCDFRKKEKENMIGKSEEKNVNKI